MPTYDEQLEQWKKAKFAPPPLKDLSPSEPTRVQMVPMRDDVKLYTEIFLPEGGGSFPVILIRSPYPISRPSWHDSRPVSRYLDAGYAVLFQMTRGQGGGGGNVSFLL